MKKANKVAEKIVDSMGVWGDNMGEAISKKSSWLAKTVLVLMVAVGLGLIFFMYRFVSGLLRRK